MNVFMIGGTGLLGSAAAAELIARGHQVKSIALPPLPEGAPIPEEMEIVLGNYLTMSDDELREKMAGCDPFSAANEANCAARSSTGIRAWRKGNG